MSDYIKTHFVIKEEQFKELKSLAERTGETMSSFCRKGLTYSIATRKAYLSGSHRNSVVATNENYEYCDKINDNKGANGAESLHKCSVCGEPKEKGFIAYEGNTFCFYCIKRKKGVPHNVRLMFAESFVLRSRRKIKNVKEWFKRESK